MPNGLNADGSVPIDGQQQAQPQQGAGTVPVDPNSQQAQQGSAAAQQAQARQDYLNHFNYGGVAGGANAAASYFNQGAEAAQNRQGTQINYGLAQGAYGQSQQNAGYQNQLAQMMLARANGQMPSIAQMQADRQMQQAQAAQMSAAASARGPAALALAQQQSAGNIAGLQSNISNQAQINGANEQLQNQNAAFGAFSGMRGQDLQGMQQQAQMAQAQGSLDAQQRAQNDQYALGLYGLGNDVQKSQLAAQGNQIGIETGATTAANNLALQSQIHSDNQTAQYIGYGLGAAGTAAGVLGAMGIFGSPAPGSVAPSVNNQGGGSNNNSYGSSYGSPGSTPGGYDANTGAPIAGTGGGFDPDTDTSDVMAKQNIAPLQIMTPSVRDPAQSLALRDVRSKQDAFAMGEQAALASKANDMAAAQQAQWQGLMSQGPAVNPTAQFAQGLAPSSYEYRPGMPGATPGMKVGPMAQNMAANPITGTAVRQMPNGLLAIDGKDGLKVALGGVGHLAQKQQVTDAQVAQLQQQLAAQRNGLLSQGPSVGQRADDSAYAPPQPPPPGADPRLAEAQRILDDKTAQGQGLIAAGPSVGQQYLDYVRGQ